MRKRITSSKSDFFVLVFAIVFFCFWEIVSIVYMMDACFESRWKNAINGALFVFVFSAILICFLFYINRAACFIWLEDGAVKRKGLFFGFHKECRVEDIQKVVTTYFWREGMFICLVDSSPNRFHHIKKDSYICFKKNKANMAFLRSFWGGEIAELPVSDRLDLEWRGK